jgi:hypothetical protein
LVLAGRDLTLVACRFVARIKDAEYDPLTGSPPSYALAVLGQV